MMRLSVVVLLLLLPVRGLAQSAVATEPPRTPWGDPDLRGMWDFATLTPLQRPPDISTTTFTEEEAAEFELSMATENRTFMATENCTLLGRTSRAERTFSR